MALTINYLSTDGTTKQWVIDGCTSGGSYTLRNESSRSTINTYAGASLHSFVYKNVVTSYYDCSTTFLSDVQASMFATDFLLSPYITITSEDYENSTPAEIETNSVSVKTNRTDGVVSYDFTIKVSTPRVWR